MTAFGNTWRIRQLSASAGTHAPGLVVDGKAPPPGKPPMFIPPQPIIPPLGDLVLPKPTSKPLREAYTLDFFSGGRASISLTIDKNLGW